MADHSSSENAAPSSGAFTATALAVIGGFAIFAIILAVAYLPNKQDLPRGVGSKSREEGKAILKELHGAEQAAATTYAWIDKDKGVVRLPLDRAIELTIQERKKK